ncbi:MAG: NAD(+) diphosphatase [Solirubrobacteraceae bacterium]
MSTGNDALAVPPRFTGALIDRAAGLRGDLETVRRLLADPQARLLGASAEGVLLTEEGGVNRLLRRPLEGHVSPHQAILLGLEEGRPLFAADMSHAEAQAISEATGAGRLVSLREAGMLVAQAEGGLAAYLAALLGWHRTHRFCSVCGTATRTAEAGLSRRCPSCGASHFPRTDPVVIMLVEHAGEVLMGRRVGGEPGRVSVLAGFVANGETPEEAVVREVHEEAGIIVHSPRYIASQPWPFPRSLMLGFETSADGGEPVADAGELAEVGWVTLEQVRAAQRGEGTMRLPGEVSIARGLIDAWVARGGHRM